MIDVGSAENWQMVGSHDEAVADLWSEVEAQGLFVHEYTFQVEPTRIRKTEQDDETWVVFQAAWRPIRLNPHRFYTIAERRERAEVATTRQRKKELLEKSQKRALQRELVTVHFKAPDKMIDSGALRRIKTVSLTARIYEVRLAGCANDPESPDFCEALCPQVSKIYAEITEVARHLRR